MPRLKKRFPEIRGMAAINAARAVKCGSMFLRDGVNIGAWNLQKQIARAEEIQHEFEELY